jgi:hypothetical protein
MHITDEVKSFLCLSPDNWQMTPGERSALIGLLERLQPRTILEFGTGFGGSTAVFDHYADAVVTVDRENLAPNVLATLRHTTFRQMTTVRAAEELLHERRHFDLALVDADHAEEAVAADVRHALQLADVILCHDAFYPATRRGIATAVRGADIFCDLEFVPGVLHRQGLFGGFALIIPGISARERYVYEPRVSPQPYLSLIYRLGRSLLWPLPRFRAWR